MDNDQNFQMGGWERIQQKCSKEESEHLSKAKAPLK
jgi:hypothetical protein